jgi:hypothetical protein
VPRSGPAAPPGTSTAAHNGSRRQTLSPLRRNGRPRPTTPKTPAATRHSGNASNGTRIANRPTARLRTPLHCQPELNTPPAQPSPENAPTTTGEDFGSFAPELTTRSGQPDTDDTPPRGRGDLGSTPNPNSPHLPADPAPKAHPHAVTSGRPRTRIHHERADTANGGRSQTDRRFGHGPTTKTAGRGLIARDGSGAAGGFGDRIARIIRR